jgi:hypothetical protein
MKKKCCAIGIGLKPDVYSVRVREYPFNERDTLRSF